MKETPNLNYLSQFSQGDKSFEQKMISIVKTEFPEEKKVYYANLEERNFKLASDNVHKIKHKMSILGLEKSYKIATDHENKLREADTSLSLEFDEIMQNISNYLTTL